MDKNEVILKFDELYGNTYDYSEVGEITSTANLIKIICPKHGEFIKTVNNHLHGQGCPECGVENRRNKTKIGFIKKANEIHQNKYNYSKVEYKNNKEKVCIICPEHGEFWMAPSTHINQGCGCPKCANKNRTLVEIINKCREVHGDNYDYSLLDSAKMSKKQKIRCNKCGRVFEVTITSHIHNKIGCKYCNHRSFKYTTEEFIQKAKQIHGSKYDYSKVEYKNNKEKVCIICPEHGEFWMSPCKHLNSKQGCPKCSASHKLTLNEFIEKARKVHCNKYDYSKVEYINTNTKVCIICPEHGEFWQTPHAHLSGKGCLMCHEENNLNESRLFNFIGKNIDGEVISQYKADWLKGQSLDIYIPSKKIGIEYQGVQHFKPVNFFGGDKKYEYTVSKDKEKYEKCKMNGIKLFYFSKEKELPKSYLDTIYCNENDLLKEIKKYGDY